MSEDNQKIFKVIESAFKDILGHDLELTLETDILSEMKIDSIDILDISFELEKTLDKNINFLELLKRGKDTSSSTPSLKIIDIIKFIQDNQ